MIADTKLDFLIQKGYNALFVGKHGVGKSTIIIDAFNRNKLKWMYFSASTMDPWVDFIGVPKEKEDPATGQSYLDLVRPKAFQDDQVEALFFDEYNRSHKKVRNAVMELIQFKSINGKKFDKLKIVWAAINPDEEDGEYDVEKLDPAQRDRFHAILELPYKPHAPYFKSKYGSEISDAAILWWNDLTPEIKDKISPRRLDYAIDFYKNNGDLRDVFPKEANVSKLIYELGSGSIKVKLGTIMKAGDTAAAKAFLSNDNEFKLSYPIITHNPTWMKFFLPLMPEEKISNAIATDEKVRTYVLNKNNYTPFASIIREIANANSNKFVVRGIKNFCKYNSISLDNSSSGFQNFYSDFSMKYSRNTTERTIYYNKIVSLNINPISMTDGELKDYIQSLFLLVKESHLQSLKTKYPKLIDLLNKSLEVWINKNPNIKFQTAKYGAYSVIKKLKKLGGFLYLADVK